MKLRCILQTFVLCALIAAAIVVQSVTEALNEAEVQLRSITDHGAAEHLDDESQILANGQSVQNAEKYDQQVIYIEAYYHRGYWLAATEEQFFGGYVVRFLEVNQDEVPFRLELKWYVENIGNGFVQLRNMKYDHYYLYAPLRGQGIDNVRAVYSGYPQGSESYRFQIEYNEHGRNRFTLKRSDEWLTLCCYYSGRMDYDFYSPDSEFRIYTPSTSDSLVVIATLDNSRRNHTAQYTYEESIGISQSTTHTVSETLTVEMGVEIKGAFSASTSYSRTWSKQDQEVFTKVVTRNVKANVGPHEILVVKQLKGNYGPFEVGAQYFVFEPKNGGIQKAPYIRSNVVDDGKAYK